MTLPSTRDKAEELVATAFANWERDTGQDTKDLAKRLCKSAGYDPEIAVMGGPHKPPMIGAKGTVVVDGVDFRPQWSLFVTEAREALDFMGRLG